MDEDDRNVILPLRVTRRYSLCRGGVAPLLALEDGALANFTDSRSTSHSYPCIYIRVVKIYIVLSALSNVDVFTRNMICGN